MSLTLTRLLCVLIVILLAGCSRTDWLYSNADWFVKRWAVGLMDPEPAQADAWQGLIEQAMKTHQRELLPDVLALLESAELAAADGLDEAELACWVDAFERAYEAHAQWLVTPASQILSELKPTQVDHMAEALRERNEEFREEYLQGDPNTRQQARVERYLDRIQRWTGDLSVSQLGLVEQAVASIPDTAESWLAYRQQRQQQLLRLLRSEASMAELQSYLTGWWVRLQGRPARLVQDARTLRAATFELVLSLDVTLSRQQRETFIAKVADLRADLEPRINTREGRQKRDPVSCGKVLVSDRQVGIR